jgi:hypothetical protein
MKKRRYDDGGLTDAMDIEMEIPETAEVRNTRGMGVEDETGAVNSRLKRNPETGELYNTQKEKPKARPKPKSFAEKAKKANFTSAETGGGAALMYRKPMAKGGMTASKRGDGIAQRGKTRGTLVMCGGGMGKR